MLPVEKGNGLSLLCVLQTPPLEGLPDLGEPDQAWPLYQHSNEEERLTVRMSDIYLKVLGTPLTSVLQGMSHSGPIFMLAQQGPCSAHLHWHRLSGKSLWWAYSRHK